MSCAGRQILIAVTDISYDTRIMTEASTALFSQPVHSLEKQTLDTNSTRTAPVEDYNWRNLAFQMFSPNKSQTEDSNAPGPGKAPSLLAGNREPT